MAQPMKPYHYADPRPERRGLTCCSRPLDAVAMGRLLPAGEALPAPTGHICGTCRRVARTTLTRREDPKPLTVRT